MHEEKCEQFARMDAHWPIERAARTQMTDRGPHAVRVPNDRRNGADREDDEQQIQRGPTEFTTVARHKCEHRDDRDELKCVRVFAKETEPDEQAGEGPPPRKFRAALERTPE